MFQLSRFLLGGSAIASSGGLASYLIPYISDSGESSIFQEGDSNTYELTRLEELLGKTRQALDEWKVKLNQSRDVALKAKNNEFSNSLELMKKISSNEEALKALYDIIKSKLVLLQTQSEKLKNKIEQKLKLDSDSAMLKTSIDYGTQLIQLLSSWENSMSKVISEFENAEKSKVAESSSSGLGGGTETEGQKAQKTLNEVKLKFEQFKKTISEAKLKVGSQQLKTSLEDWEVYLQQVQTTGVITWLEQYIKLINSTIYKTNNRASLKAEEINKNNEDLRKSHENYNKFKSFQANFHQFGEQFQLKIQNIDSFLEK